MPERGFHFDSTPLPTGTRVACRIEYDGSHYSGWQTQPHLNVVTVQGELERALAAVATAPVRVHCAGRTDTGVHGFSQVIHFDTPAERSAKSWVLGGNANLPMDIRLHWAQAVEADFHARFSALSRCYRYLIANTPVRPALMGGQLTWYRYPLDDELMQTEGQCLLGELDFSAFRAAACQSASPMRNVYSLRVWRQADLVVMEIRANAFLHHMVRNIAGSLMAVGSGRRPAGWIAELLVGRDRTVAADTAAPDGLYLVDVEYPQHYGLPDTPQGPIAIGK